MAPKTRRQTLALLCAATALSGCGNAPMIVDPKEGDPFEGGIGGTGIVGVLNGFGSLRVNGLRVELTRNTRYRTALGKALAQDLKPGQALTIEAQRVRGTFLARAVTIDHVLVGQVTRHGTGMAVNGVPVRLERGATGGLIPGSRVAVSGVWTPKGVSASRIDPVADMPDLVAGTVSAPRRGSFAIGPAQILYSGASPASGSYAVAFGRAYGAMLEADRIERGRFQGAVTLRQLSIEGYLEPTNGAPGYRIAGLGHSFARGLTLGPIGSRRAIYFGAYSGLFDARAGYVVDAEFDRRRSALQDGVNNPVRLK